MTEPKRCCGKPVKLVIRYDNEQLIFVCQDHSKKFEYQRGVKAIFDYKTKKQLTTQEAFS